MNVAQDLLLAATVSSCIACGATFDQTFKQLPARHRIGTTTYSAYIRAADLRNGLIWYPIIGISTTLLAITAVVTGLLDHPTATRTVALAMMALGTVAFAAATWPRPAATGLQHGCTAGSAWCTATRRRQCAAHANVSGERQGSVRL
jgi:hypothetical protein